MQIIIFFHLEIKNKSFSSKIFEETIYVGESIMF